MASKKAKAPTVAVKRWFHTGGTTKAGKPTNTLAYADGVFMVEGFGPLVVTGIRIVKRNDGGLFASFKQRESGGKWYGEQYFLDELARESFNTTMLKSYKADVKRLADES